MPPVRAAGTSLEACPVRHWAQTTPERIAIHGSDNAMETQHYLHAIYGGRHAEICDELERLCAR